MKTRKNVKGFTLVELIVVIAIIAVLAAILVPSLLGYVKKSKISSANTEAKNCFDAVNTTLIEWDSEGGTPLTNTNQDISAGKWSATKGTATVDLAARVEDYFAVSKLVAKGGSASAMFTANACEATLVNDGVYTGSYPQAAPAKDASGNDNGKTGFTWTLTDAKG